MKLKYTMLLATLGIGLISSCGQDERSRENKYQAKPITAGGGDEQLPDWCKPTPTPTPPTKPCPECPKCPDQKPCPPEKECPKCPDQKPCEPCPPCQKCPDQKPTPEPTKPTPEPTKPTPEPTKPNPPPPPDQKPGQNPPPPDQKPGQKPPMTVYYTPCPCAGQATGYWMDIYGGWHVYTEASVVVPGGWWMDPYGVWHPYV
jgi:hypothetical protein